MFFKYVLIKGAGDLASGTACLLNKAGFSIVMTEIPEPTCVRRKVSFAEAVYEGETLVEDVKGVLVKDFAAAKEVTKRGEVAVLVDPEGNLAKEYPPEIFIDGSMSKKNRGTHLGLGKIVLALGPGFEGGKDVHAVIETQRGPHLGDIIYNGFAIPDSGIPGDVLGHTSDRLLRASAAGIFREVKTFGDFVEQGDIVAYVDDHPVKSRISGTVRGLLKSGLAVYEGMKAGDIHPAKDAGVVFAVTDKAWIIGRGILKAILALGEQNAEEKRKNNLALFSRLNQFMEQSKPGLVFTVLDAGQLEELKIGTRLFVTGDREAFGSLRIPALDQELIENRSEGMKGHEGAEIITWALPWPETSEAGNEITILREHVVPQKKLIIFGGGHISLPLAEMAKILGYRVIVIDDREEFANSERFKTADRVICADFIDVLKGNLIIDEIDCATSIVIVTRGHAQDKTCVQHLANHQLSYLGMIGSKNKVKQSFKALLEEGFPRAQLEKISSPIGLDLGGQSPAEIALSILAEMVAKEHQASGKPVKELKGVLF